METGEKFGEEIKKYGVSSTNQNNQNNQNNQSLVIKIKGKNNGCQVAQNIKLCHGARKLDKNSKKYNQKKKKKL